MALTPPLPVGTPRPKGWVASTCHRVRRRRGRGPCRNLGAVASIFPLSNLQQSDVCVGCSMSSTLLIARSVARLRPTTSQSGFPPYLWYRPSSRWRKCDLLSKRTELSLHLLGTGHLLVHKHCDADYHHSSNEINFWLPRTACFGSNTLWSESTPGAEDFHPFELVPICFTRRLWPFTASCSLLGDHYSCIRSGID